MATMTRLSYHIDDSNKNRLEVLKAFATFRGEQPSLSDLLNQSVEQYFILVYQSYSEVASESDMILLTLRRLLPDGGQSEGEDQKTDTKRFKPLAQSQRRSNRGSGQNRPSPPRGPYRGAGTTLLPDGSIPSRRHRSRLPGGSLTLSPPAFSPDSRPVTVSTMICPYKLE